MNKKVKVAILISGRGSNMRSLVESCESGFVPAEVGLILSNKKDAPGLEYAKNKGIKTAIVNHKDFSSREEFDKRMNEILVEENIEIVCLAGFMRLLSGWFVGQWMDRLVNIHPSYLPEFKGADAVGDAIKSGAKKSGCTVHYVREEMDSGPIIKQVRVDVLEGDTKEDLAARILECEHKIYPQALKTMCENLN